MSTDTPEQSAASRSARLTPEDYGEGHCWYYRLGGKVLGPKSISKQVERENYLGYRTDIADAESLPEPRRSVTLKRIKDDVRKDLKSDIARYRHLACEFRKKRTDEDQHRFLDHCMNISIKYCHIYNDLGHLRRINDALSVQRDLFDF